MTFKSLLTASAAAGALSLAAPASAEWYVSVFSGVSVSESDFGIGPVYISSTQREFRYTYYATRSTAFFGTQNGYYASFQLGLSETGTIRFYQFQSDNKVIGTLSDTLSETGFVVGLALGANFIDTIRAELELSFRDYTGQVYSSGSGTRSRFFAPLYYGPLIGYGTVNYFSYRSDSGLYWNLTRSLTNTSFTHYGPAYRVSSAPSSHVSTVVGIVGSDLKLDVFSIMANLWYDFDLSGKIPITPFIGGGIGATNVAVDYSGTLPFVNYTATFGTETSDWTWAWQAGAGLAYEFGNGMSISAQYRYFATGDVEVTGQDIGIQSHEALIGLSIPLGN